MTTATNSESFILEQVLDRPFSEKINAKSVFVKKIWPNWAPIAQKGAKRVQSLQSMSVWVSNCFYIQQTVRILL